MPPINKNIELGSIHISLPFKSMDDVSFSGSYAPLADKLVETLQNHLKQHENDESNGVDNTEDSSDTNDNSDNSDITLEQIKNGLPNVSQ